jgi:urease accessory protein
MFDTRSSLEVNGGWRPLGSPQARRCDPSDEDLQRAEGSGRIVVSASEKGARITEVFQRSPIRIMFPRVGGAGVEEGVVINTAGGVAGGDRLECAVTALANSSIAVTSQAAEKVYRALKQPAQIATKLKAEAGARLAWLPQETIVFNSGRICRDMEIEVSSRSELLALEWLVLGRAARGEEVVGGHISDSWRVKRDDRLIWADSFRVTDGVFPQLRRRALLSDCKAVATLIYLGPALEIRLEVLRDIAASLDCQWAATLVGGLIVARFAATASIELRAALCGFLQQFNREFGPGPFRVPKMWSC